MEVEAVVVSSEQVAALVPAPSEGLAGVQQQHHHQHRDVQQQKERKRKANAPANDAMDLTGEEARCVAEAEGLTLIETPQTQTGFLYVYFWGKTNAGGKAHEVVEQSPIQDVQEPATSSSTAVVGASQPGGGKITTGVTRRFQLQPQKGNSLGYYRSAEGAALAYARLIGVEASAAKAKAVSARAALPQSSILTELCNVGAEAALRMAEEEGLTLVRSTRGRAGFKHVATFAPGMKGLKRFRLNAQAGVTTLEGNFASAEAAALAHARQIGAETSAAEAADEARKGAGMLKKELNSAVRMGDVQMLGKDEALRLAAQEGLAGRVEALRSAKGSKSGFRHVTWHCDGPKHKSTKKSRPFQLLKPSGKRGKDTSVGYFASAEAAALVYARIQQYEETSRCDGNIDEGSKAGPAGVAELHSLGVASGPATAALHAQLPPPPALPLQTAAVAVEVLDEREAGGIASPDLSITATAELCHPLISTG